MHDISMLWASHSVFDALFNLNQFVYMKNYNLKTKLLYLWVKILMLGESWHWTWMDICRGWRYRTIKRLAKIQEVRDNVDTVKNIVAKAPYDENQSDNQKDSQ